MKTKHLAFLLLALFALSPALLRASPEKEDLIPELTRLAAVLKSGEKPPIWQSSLPGDIDEMRFVSGAGVLVGQTKISWDSEVYIPSYGPYIMYDADTGKKKWEFSRHSSYDEVYDLVATKPLILIENLNSKSADYIALNPSTGKQAWSYSAELEQKIALDARGNKLVLLERRASDKDRKEGKAVVASLTAIELATGKTLWKISVGGIPASTPLPDLEASRDALILSGATLVRYSLADGKEQWSLGELGRLAPESYALRFGEGMIAFPNDRGTVAAIDSKGQVAWRSDSGGAIGLMVEREGSLYLQDRLGAGPDRLSCLSSRDGKKLWSSELKGKLDSEILPAEGKLACVVKDESQRSLALEIRDASTGAVASRVELPVDTMKRLPDRLLAYPGRVVLVGEHWVGAFSLSEGRKLWFYAIPGTDLTLKDLQSSLPGKIEYAQAMAALREGRKAGDLDKALESGALALENYVRRTDAKILSDPDMPVSSKASEMETLYSNQRVQAFTDLTVAGTNAMLAMAAARQEAVNRSYSQYWNAGMRILGKLQQQAVQGDFYLRSYEGKDSSRGVALIDLSSGAWKEIRTSPTNIYLHFAVGEENMDFQLPVLSDDGKRLFARSLGLDPSKWNPAKDKTLRVASYDTVHIRPTPSILSYDVGEPSSLDAEKYAKSHYYGYADKSGNFVIEPRFDVALDFEDGKAIVGVDGKYGLIDTSGRFLLEPISEILPSFKDGYCEIVRDKKYGLVDSSYKLFVEPKYDFIYAYKDDMLMVQRDAKYGFLDRAGKEVIEPRFAVAEDFHDGMARVSFYNKEGYIVKTYIDKQGRIALPEGRKWTSLGWFGEGLAAVQENGKFGYVDKSFRFVIPPQFRIAGFFSGGLAAAALPGGKLGAIDRSGKFVIPPEYDSVGPFVGGVGEAVRDGKIGKIDATGKVLSPFKYDLKTPLIDDPRTIVRMGKKYGMIDQAGNEIVPLSYDSITTKYAEGFSGEYVYLVSNGKDYYLDESGQAREGKPNAAALAKMFKKPASELTPKTLGPRYWEK